MKIKLGTQMEEKVYRNLKVAAARENRAIGDVIQEAVAVYLQQQSPSRGLKSGLARLLESPPLALSDSQFRDTMEVDFFDQ
jgi:hypothetical protein